jgi:hypothetical protein
MDGRKVISSQAAGLIIAALLIVVSCIIFYTGDKTSRPGGGWMSYLLIIGGLVFFINLYGKAKDNYVSFGDLFAYGFKAASMFTLVFLIFIVILAVAMPEMKTEAIESARMEMEKNKSFSDSDIDKGIQLVEKYFWVFMAGATMVGFLVIGAIGSLIGATVTKKKPKIFIDQLDQSNS